MSSKNDLALSLHLDLEDIKFKVTGLRGEEGVSKLFWFDLDLRCKRQTKIPFDKIVGTKATVTLSSPHRPVRHFSGLIAEFVELPPTEKHRHFQIHLVPAFWILQRTLQSRIFQNENVVGILRKILAKIPHRFDLKRDPLSTEEGSPVQAYEPYPYKVQFQESDYDFACRVMEDEGLYFYFEHHKDHHLLVIADTSTRSHDVLRPLDQEDGEPKGSDSRFEPHFDFAFDTSLSPGLGKLVDWRISQRLRSNKVTLWDHNFQKFGHNLEAAQTLEPRTRVGQTEHNHAISGDTPLERYEFPGGHGSRFDAVGGGGQDDRDALKRLFVANHALAEIRGQEAIADAIVIAAGSDCPALIPGYRFATINHHDGGDGEYWVTHCCHKVQLQGDHSDGHHSDDFEAYHNTFQCIPAGVLFRPVRRTAKPVIRGVQLAMVTAAKDEQISTDPFGRVKIKFLWDRSESAHLDSSCWVRVTHSWAGSKFGEQCIPWVGMEVVVSFVDGDIDRPIIVGSVYNSTNMPPFDLPDERMISGVRSRSKTNDATIEQANEFYFDDSSGNEEIHLHAQRDLYMEAERSENIKVGPEEFDDEAGTKAPPPAKDSSLTGRINSKIVGIDKAINSVLKSVNDSVTNAVDKTGEKTADALGLDKSSEEPDVRPDPTYSESDSDSYKDEVIDGWIRLQVNQWSDTTVNGDLREVIKGHEEREVWNNHTETIWGDVNQTIKGNCTQSIDGKYTQNVTAASKTFWQGAKQTTQGGADSKLWIGMKNDMMLGLVTKLYAAATINVYLGADIKVVPWGLEAVFSDIKFSQFRRLKFDWVSGVKVDWSAATMNLNSVMGIESRQIKASAVGGSTEGEGIIAKLGAVRSGMRALKTETESTVYI